MLGPRTGRTQERIFEPLQMYDSSLRDQFKIVKGRVPVYALRNGELINWRANNDVSNQLKSLKPLVYLGSDVMAGRRFRRHGQPIVRAVYHRGDTDGRRFFFIFWLTDDGKVADVQFYVE